jgi:hypothetical protein
VPRQAAITISTGRRSITEVIDLDGDKDDREYEGTDEDWARYTREAVAGWEGLKALNPHFLFGYFECLQQADNTPLVWLNEGAGDKDWTFELKHTPDQVSK